MNKHCPTCNHKYEIETGFFFGAMYVSYVLCVAQAVTVFVISLFFFEDVFDPWKVLVIGIVLLLLSFFNYRFSRLIWMYIFTGKGKGKTGYIK